MVKSAKYHLKRVIGEILLSYEEMNTLLVEIEACLNSRPLLPLSDDKDDYSASEAASATFLEPLVPRLPIKSSSAV